MPPSLIIAVGAAIVGFAAAPAGAGAVELVRDGGFEAGTPNPAWVESDNMDSAGTPLCSTKTCATNAGWSGPRTGKWWTWFGGFSLLPLFKHTASVAQTVTIPAGVPSRLTFWLWIGHSSDSSALNVSLGGTQLFAVRGGDTRFQRGYQPVEVAIPGSAASGAPQRLTFDYEGLPGLLDAHVLNLDDVSLRVADSDLGVGLSSAPPTVPVGANVVATMTATNHGPESADEVTARYRFPTGATVVGLAAGAGSCTTPETRPGQDLRCDFGTLPSGASRSIAVTLHADAVGAITQVATIGQRLGDGNPANSSATATTTVVAAPVEQPKPEPKPKCTAAKRFHLRLQRGTTGNGLLLKTHSPTTSRIRSAVMTGPRGFKRKRLSFTRSRVTVDLRRVPAGRYKVRTTVRLRTGKTVSVTKAYTACGAASTSKATTTTSAKKTKKTSVTKKTTTAKTAAAKTKKKSR